MFTLSKKSLLLVLLVAAMPLGDVVAANNGVVKFVRKLGAAIDSAALRGADRDYLAMPERPWQVMVRGSTNQGDLKMSTMIDGQALIGPEWGDVTMEPRLKTGVTQYVGVAANYRGYGLCYSEDVGGSRGSLLHLSVTGGCYGLNLRIHQYKTDEPEIRLTFDNPMPTDTTFSDIIPNPIKVRTMMLDAYYFFNSKRFSYCAAYDQSIIQKRSAGSLLVGAMYYHSTIAYDQDDNAELVMLMGDVGKIKHWQVSLGLQYTRLSSSLASGNTFAQLQQEQRVQYLDLPLKAGWRQQLLPRLSLNAAANVTLQLPLRSTLDSRYVINGSVVETGHDRLHPGLQWSAGVGLGLQYDVTPAVGFFVEPSLQHYFRNGSGVETWQTEHPFVVTVPLGIRITIK